jgi:hypothetical protein
MRVASSVAAFLLSCHGDHGVPLAMKRTSIAPAIPSIDITGHCRISVRVMTTGRAVARSTASVDGRTTTATPTQPGLRRPSWAEGETPV